MQKRLLILIDKKGPAINGLVEFVSQTLKDEAKVELATFCELKISFDTNKLKVTVGGRDINDYNLIYFRRADHSLFSLAGTLAICLDYFGIRYFDTRFRKIGAAGDKMTALVKLFVAGLPVIPTSFTLGEQEIDMKIPFVSKELSSQHSTGIYMIRKKGDIKKLPKTGENGRIFRYLHQKKINIDSEYRLLVMGNKVVSAQKMYRNLDGFAAKIDMDRKEEFIDLEEISEEMKHIAIKAAGVLNIQIAGTDLAIEKKTGKVWLLEVNRGPGFTYDTKISPEIPELAKFLRQELTKS